MTMKRRTRSNPKGLSRSISAASATMLGRGFGNTDLSGVRITAIPVDETDGFDVKDWNGIHVTLVADRTLVADSTSGLRVRVRPWRYYKTHPSRVADARTVGRWVQDYDRWYSLDQPSMLIESQHHLYDTRNADKMYFQFVEFAVGQVKIPDPDEFIDWIHLQPWGLIRKDEPLPAGFGCCGRLPEVEADVKVSRAEPELAVQYEGTLGPIGPPIELYLPSEDGFRVRDLVDGTERRNIATYVRMLPASGSIMTLQVQGLIWPMGATPRWVNISPAGYNINSTPDNPRLRNSWGVEEWVVDDTGGGGVDRLEVRVDHDGVRDMFVRWWIRGADALDQLTLYGTATEEN